MVLNDNQRRNSKRRYPFLFGTTSYIIPDDIIPNVRMLSGIVDDIELVLFESPDGSNIPTVSDIRELKSIADDNDCGFTVHLPTGRKAGSAEKKESDLFVDDAKKIINRCSLLQPGAWIVHLEGIEKNASKAEVTAWELRCFGVIEELCGEVETPSRLAIENLGYPWYWHLYIAAQTGVSLCCDIGHLWLYYPECWKEYAASMIPQTSVIHLHGVTGGKDHISLARNDTCQLFDFIGMLVKTQYKGIITLEVFNQIDFDESREVFSKIWEK